MPVHDPNLGLVEEFLPPICFPLGVGRVLPVLEASAQMEVPAVLGPPHGGSS